jgi:hypothetical protein
MTHSIRATAATGLALVAALAIPTFAAGASSDLSIQAEQGGFFGFLSSPKHQCELNRTVKLYKVRRGADQKVGSDVAQPNGPDSQWFVSTDKSGKFYAKVGATDTCAKAVSPVVHSE